MDTRPQSATGDVTSRSGASEGSGTSRQRFQAAQRRVLDRYGIHATSRYVDVPVIGGRAHVLEAGEGPPLVMVIGGIIPAVMWAPLMQRLDGHHVYAMDLPGFGLTGPTNYQAGTMRPVVTEFLAQVLDGLGVARSRFITNSQGSLWTTWLSLDQPDRVVAQVQIGCPAHILGTTAPLPMRLMSIPGLGRLLLNLQPPSAGQVEQVARMVGEDLSGLPELRDVLLACERLPDYGDSLLALMQAVMHLGRARTQIAMMGDELTRVRHPVQMIWGADDPFGSPAVARRAVALIPDAELHVVAGGHAPWFRYAENVAALVHQFFDRSPPTGRNGA